MLGSSSLDLLISRSWNSEKATKFWYKFSCLTKKKFIFPVKSRRKINNKYYVICIQNSNFGKLDGHKMVSYLAWN